MEGGEEADELGRPRGWLYIGSGGVCRAVVAADAWPAPRTHGHAHELRGRRRGRHRGELTGRRRLKEAQGGRDEEEDDGRRTLLPWAFGSERR